MSDDVQDKLVHPDLQERILELERENARLRAELEQRQQGEATDQPARVQDIEALNDGLSRFRIAFEHAAFGFAITNVDRRFLDANAAYCRLTGYSVEELQDLGLSDLVHPDDYEANMQLIERQAHNEIPPFQIENRYIRKDGRVVWVRKSVSWVSGPDGKPQWLVALVEDITRQRKAEQERRTSELIYRAIGEAIPYGILI
jgi:PAS domain S-box-containing protein